MAQLKDTTVQGDLNVIGNLITKNWLVKDTVMLLSENDISTNTPPLLISKQEKQHLELYKDTIQSRIGQTSKDLLINPLGGKVRINNVLVNGTEIEGNISSASSLKLYKTITNQSLKDYINTLSNTFTYTIEATNITDKPNGYTNTNKFQAIVNKLNTNTWNCLVYDLTSDKMFNYFRQGETYTWKLIGNGEGNVTQDQLSNFVKKTGDILTGDLTLNKSVLNLTHDTSSFRITAAGNQMYFDVKEDKNVGNYQAKVQIGPGYTTINNKLSIAPNEQASALIELNRKSALKGVDTWLRLNPDNKFTSGIFCSTSTIRTDGAYQIGELGEKVFLTSDGNGIFAKQLTTKEGQLNLTTDTHIKYNQVDKCIEFIFDIDTLQV